MDLTLLSYNKTMHSSPPQQQQAHESPAREVDPKPTRREFSAESEEAVVDPAVGVKYRECMRNHAASMGGLASDGCGEFMPSSDGAGKNASSPLSCAACGCHRSFHRRERVHHNRHRVVPPSSIVLYGPPMWDHKKKMVVSAPAPLQTHVITTPRNNNPNNLEDQEGLLGSETETPERDQEQQSSGCMNGTNTTMTNSGCMNTSSSTNKRFRTKFSSEQKERMAEYAERAGWRINRQDDAALSEFCAEIGVKRNVLKVWMHNNKAAAAAAMRRAAATTPPPAVSAPPPQHAGV